ncbi:MAG: DUF885 domain-containing protein [Rhodospirillaceae bacterium]
MKLAPLVQIVLLLVLLGCDNNQPQEQIDSRTESERFRAFVDERFDVWVARDPEWQSHLGIKADYGRWDDISPGDDINDLAVAEEDMRLMKLFDFGALDDQARISYRLFEMEVRQKIESYAFRFHRYPVNQMFGVQSEVPAFLINIHQVANRSDAEAYISRLYGVRILFTQLIARMRAGQDAGILPPKFVFDSVLRDSTNVLTGKPFDESDLDSTLLADFRKKVKALGLDAESEADLVLRATEALLEAVDPAYRGLIAFSKEQKAIANTDDGVWKHPNGTAYYQHQLKYITTTDLTAEDIHNLGLSEVERIQNEMRSIMESVNFEGDLQAFFSFMRNDSQFYLPNTEEGRTHYLTRTTALIDDIQERLESVFKNRPKADLNVKRVESFRERSTGKAFYQSPSPTGDRPGRYYVNLYDMTVMPTYELDALAYHEAIPGHHMQIAIAQELEKMPKFRKYGGFTAYIEGWGLYAELLPKEMGLYENPYADFGRLSMELWRACRLVVDTGIHDRKWTREEAITYLKKTTPAPDAEITKSVERYIVMPGQATAYKIGMLKILELREWARSELGDKFDIREYHDVVLNNGALPLSVLDEQVRVWVATLKF